MRYSCFIPSVVHTPAHLPLNRHSPYNQICGRNAGHLHQPVLRSIPSHIPAFAYLAPNVPSKRGRRYTTVLWNLFAKCSKNMLPRKNSPACASLRFRGACFLFVIVRFYKPNNIVIYAQLLFFVENIVAHALVQPAAHIGVSDVFHQPHGFHEFAAGQGAWVVLTGEKPHGHIGILRGVTARIREHRHSEHLLIAVLR